VIMRSLEISPADRPKSVIEWIEQLEEAAEDVRDRKTGTTRLVVMGPTNSEVYINDERKASIGSSGRVVLSDVPVGQHILRVSRAGERDDERLIEIREGAGEQLIQAQLRPTRGTGSQPSPSQGSGAGSASESSVLPGIVACENCHSRFAEGVRFCGRCGNRSFVLVTPGESTANFPCPRCSSPLPQNSRFCGRCGLSITPTSQPSFARPATFTSMPSRQVPQQAERVCRRCGGVYPANIKFCGRCGGPLG
jgi:RNA polymerase subunit RPABC4/transcription elongation factor Spt4